MLYVTTHNLSDITCTDYYDYRLYTIHAPHIACNWKESEDIYTEGGSE